MSVLNRAIPINVGLTLRLSLRHRYLKTGEQSSLIVRLTDEEIKTELSLGGFSTPF